MSSDQEPAHRGPRPWTATGGFILLMGFIASVIWWSAPGLGQGLLLAEALSGGEPFEPLGIYLWALGFAVSLVVASCALGLVWPALSALRGSRRGRARVTTFTLLLVGAMLPWLGYWDDWPLVVSSGAALTLLWLPQTTAWLSGARGSPRG